MAAAFTHGIPKFAFGLSELCVDLAENIATKHRAAAHEPPLVGLNMAYAPLVQCFELLNHYYDIWRFISPSAIREHGPAKILSDNEGRVSLIQRSTFIQTMSSFEAAAKLAITTARSPIVISGKRIYLGGIMKQSRVSGLIDDVDAELWSFAVELRNCMVHNNAVADKDLSLILEDGSSLDMVAARMSQSTPYKNALMIKAILLAYGRWCDAFLASARTI